MEQQRNQPANKEHAEGSRQNVNVGSCGSDPDTAESLEQGSGPSRDSELPPESFGERGGRKDVERETAQENPTLPGDEATTRTEI
jgi:hypothetical protein